MNVLNVLSFPKRGHTGAAETLSGAQRGTLRSPATKLFLEEDVGLLTLVCNFKKQITNKNKKQSVAARLGDDFEMGQSFNEFIYRSREERAS